MKKTPNFVFILSDDQGAWAMHCAGNQDINTPNLDKLASEGVRFDEFYCTSPVCSPARASLVTGKIPSCHGVLDWIEKGNVDAWKYPHMSNLQGFDMSDKGIEYLKEHKTYMEILAENGYECALSGKWHLGNNAEKKKGFSKWYTIGRGGCHYYHSDICDEGEISEGKGYITDLITERALRYIDELSQSEKPFYLSVHYTSPHSPWDANEHPKEYLDLYKNCRFEATPDLPINPYQIDSCPVGDTPEKRRENLTGYYAAISAMDAGIGKILEKIEICGIEEDTIVIFTADNGMNMGHHGIWGKGNGTYPPNMYDSAVKVPFIVRIPDSSAQGAVCSCMTSQYDVYPTILELAGISFEKEEKQPGNSIVNLMMHPEEPDQRRVVVYDEYGKTRMIKRGRYKYIHRYGDEFCEFYDMEEDPEEMNNLYSEKKYQEKIEELKREMETWFEQYSYEKTDGRKYAVTGKGQVNLCYKGNAFDQNMNYYK